MCGLLGGVFAQPVGPSHVDAFRHAVRTLAHRGPDAETVQAIPEANAILAFRRLAIIDLATGDQPMSLGNGRHLVFNGEIYNYRELRRQLLEEGARFRTASDTEVLLQLLARRANRALDEVRGMFAFGMLDTSRRHLLLGRDRLGVKQLYYAHGPTGFFFASEPKALLALPWVRAELDEEQLPAYFAFRCVPAPSTLFRGISKLRPGTLLSYGLDTRRVRIDSYWTLPEDGAGEPVPARHALDAFEAAFLQSVRRRLVADVPVGAFLSGGLDSSTVVAGMRRAGHPHVRTFSAAFPGSRDDESRFARRVAQRFGADHHEFAAAPESFVASLPAWVELNDDLVADASALPLLGVSRMARESGTIVLLSGEGSDELFSGYGSYHKFLLLRRLAALVPSEAGRRGIASCVQRLSLLHGQDRPRVNEYFVRRGAYMGTAALLGTPDLDRLLARLHNRAASLPRARGTRLAALCGFDFERRIPDDLLVRTDRASMGASIEARVPFLDHDLVELAFRLPSPARSLPGVSKVLLRRLAARWGVPVQTIVHRKIGFQLPIGEWFRQSLRPLWTDVLRERVVPGLDYEYVGALFDAHDRRRAHFEELLWRVLALELWYRRWISGGETRLREPARQAAAA